MLNILWQQGFLSNLVVMPNQTISKNKTLDAFLSWSVHKWMCWQNAHVIVAISCHIHCLQPIIMTIAATKVLSMARKCTMNNDQTQSSLFLCKNQAECADQSNVSICIVTSWDSAKMHFDGECWCRTNYQVVIQVQKTGTMTNWNVCKFCWTFWCHSWLQIKTQMWESCCVCNSFPKSWAPKSEVFNVHWLFQMIHHKTLLHSHDWPQHLRGAAKLWMIWMCCKTRMLMDLFVKFNFFCS